MASQIKINKKVDFQFLLSLLFFKTSANLRTEVSRYYLNYLWWVVEPVITMGVFYIVFGIFMARGTEHYVAFLLVGLTMWNWFSRGVQHASNSIHQGRSLMLHVNISKLFFPLEVFFRDTFKELFVTALLLIFLIFYPTPVEITWLAFPVIFLITGLLVLSVGIICSALVPFVPDLSFIISTGLQLMFFGSGIFFRIEDVVLPEHQYIMYLNPMAGLIKYTRDVLIYGVWPDWVYLAKVFCLSLVMLLFGCWLVRKNEHVYPRVCNR